MAYRQRSRGTTTRRGYGQQHQTERQRRLAAWRPGDPCARCHQPMWQQQRWSNGKLIAAIHLGHTPDRAGYTGLEHDTCNEADGAARGNRKRGQRRALAKAGRVPAATIPGTLRTSRNW